MVWFNLLNVRCYFLKFGFVIIVVVFGMVVGVFIFLFGCVNVIEMGRI